jgi:hypothetical protein
VSVVLVTMGDGGRVVPLLSVRVQQLGGAVTHRSHDMKVELYLQHLTVQVKFCIG